MDLARALAATRLAIGTAVLAQPGRARAIWSDRLGARGDVRLLGLRDLGLGAVLVAARRVPALRRPGLVAGVAADAADLVLCTVAYRRRRHPLALVAAVSAIGGMAMGVRAARHPVEPGR